MGEKYTIPVIGEIGKDVTVNDILIHLNAAKNYSSIDLAIDSPGGDVVQGLKMYELLRNSGKQIHAYNTGNIASIAVCIFLSGHSRNFDTSKGMFLIHNPFVTNFEGDVKAIETAKKELQKVEKQIIDIYALNTGIDAELIRGVMEQGQALTKEQIEALRFAQISENKIVNIVSYYKPEINKSNIKMEEKLNMLEKGLAKLLSFFIKNIVLQDVNGVELEFPDMQSPDQLAVGQAVNVDGKPAEGSYVMADGKTVVCVGGKVTEIIMPMPVDDKLQQLEKENTQLKTELETVKAQAIELKENFVKFKSQFKQKDVQPAAVPTEKKDDAPLPKFSFKSKKSK